MCGLGSGGHEGTRENSTESKKGENEKSVFLFSVSALMSGEAICRCSSTSVIVIASEGNVRLKTVAQVRWPAGVFVCTHVHASVYVSHKHTPLSAEEDSLYISCVYRYQRFSQPCKRHWSMTERVHPHTLYRSQVYMPTVCPDHLNRSFTGIYR